MAEIKVGTSVILLRDGKVLVGKRKGSHGDGLWAFPGGHIDPEDSSFKMAGEREVLEETGIVCNVFRPDGVREEAFVTCDILGVGKRYATVYLLADCPPETPETIPPLEPHKCEEWRWVTLDELDELVRQGSEEQTTWIPMTQVKPCLENLMPHRVLVL